MKGDTSTRLPRDSANRLPDFLKGENVICPECKRAGMKSKVYIMGSTSTLMAVNPYYDEEGNYHSGDPNWRTTRYNCSNGHLFTRATRDGDEPIVEILRGEE